MIPRPASTVPSGQSASAATTPSASSPAPSPAGSSAPPTGNPASPAEPGATATAFAAAGRSGYLSRPARGSEAPSAPGPPARSSSRPRTVSPASDLFVPITPVGPRLSQPDTYSPGSGEPSGPSTRPRAFGTTE